MLVSSDSMRSFMQKYEGRQDPNIDLNELVLKYRETNSNEDFALICNRVLGVVTSQAQKLNNPDFTEADAFSHGLEIIQRATIKWDPYRKTKNEALSKDKKIKVSFLTFVHRAIQNDFNTFAYKSKQYRSYLYRKGASNKNVKKPRKLAVEGGESSLDELIDVLGNNAYDYLPSEQFCLKPDLPIKRAFEKDTIAYKIIDAICENKTTRKADLAKILDMPLDQLKIELKNIKYSLQSRGLFSII